MDIFDLQNKVIVITGGLGILGRNYSQALMERGAKVAIFDLTDPADATCRELLSNHPESLEILNVDITRKQSIEEGFRRVVERFGEPHGLINNAALDAPPNAPIEENGPFERYPENSWDAVMEVNVKGVFLTCQVIGDRMARAGGGSIINIGSTYGLVSPDQRIYDYRKVDGVPFTKPIAYSASKSSVLNITRYLATYWAKQSVRVNTLSLGGVHSGQDPDFLEGYCHRVPMGRMANADEYNGAVIFLLSDASSYMTGSNLVIDGGWTAW